MINPSGNGSGTVERLIPQAQAFLFSRMSEMSEWQYKTLSDEDIQCLLFQWWMNSNHPELSGMAELCLRSYVSHSIREACLYLASSWLSGSSLRYQDLLPFVLDDDGRTPLNNYLPFSMHVLRSYKIQWGYGLREWTKKLVKQHQDLGRLLRQYDIYICSDWAVLNRATIKQAASSKDKMILAAYHRIYRRDRLLRYQQGSRSRCLAPSSQQIIEISHDLLNRGLQISGEELMEELRLLASYLRQQAFGHSRTYSLDDSMVMGELEDFAQHSDSNTLEDQDLERLQQFLDEHLLNCLDSGITRALQELIDVVKKGRRSHMADKIIPIIDRVYNQRQSLNQISGEMQVNQSFLSRVIAPLNLIKEAQHYTCQCLVNLLCERLQSPEWIDMSMQSLNQELITKGVEDYLETKVFKQAKSEIQSGRNRNLSSLYAQQIRCVLAELLD